MINKLISPQQTSDLETELALLTETVGDQPPRKSSVRALATRATALVLLIGCFALSGALRVGDVMVGVSSLAALAEEPAAKAQPEAAPKMAEKAKEAEAKASTKTEEMADKSATTDESQAAPEEAMPSITVKRPGETAAPPPQKQDGEMEMAEAKPAKQDEHPAKTSKPSKIKGHAGGSVSVESEESRLLSRLRAREIELEAYAAELEQRKAEIEKAARKLEERIDTLARSKDKFEQLVETVNEASERDVGHLISVYQKMKPKDAAALFDSMDPSFAAGFLTRMKPDRAAAILAGMNTASAYAVSLEMAGRNVVPDLINPE